jgi:hypothetical protein
MKKVLSIILLAIAASYGSMYAQQTTVITDDTSGWYKIGEAQVDFKKDRDEITVLGADRFKSIKLIVVNAPIELKDLEITFETGKKQDVKINTALKAEGETAVIDLVEGETRSIKKIGFIYKTQSYSDVKAVVQVWGLKTNTDTK